MGELSVKAEPLAKQVEKIFSAKGRLTTALTGFRPRQAQLDLAKEIAECIEKKQLLIAEAGTGTGKTFAYLVPTLLSGRKAVVSTATKTLQDQLFHKDLPRLVEALGLSVKLVNLKGRANYVCHHRTLLYAEEGVFDTKQQRHDIHYIRQNIGRLVTGVRSELPEISEDSSVWSYATSTADNCLGQKCSHFNECFLVKARKKALEADIVVINHHLFFADSQLKQGGFAELLPGVDIVIFDEAHQLHDIATQFNGKRLGTRQIESLLADLQNEWPADKAATQIIGRYQQDIMPLLGALRQCCGRDDRKVSWDKVCRQTDFLSHWQQLESLLNTLIDELRPRAEELEKGAMRCFERLQEARQFFQLLNEKRQSMIVWLETFKRSMVVHMTPQSVAEQFSSQVSCQHTCHIFTSATLTMADSFDYFVKPLGLNHAKTAIYPSPFNYAEQALLYLPRKLPDIKDKSYHEQLIFQVLPVIEACGGRTFFLFTSHWALKQVASLLANKLKFPLLIQGEESKTILLSRFRESGKAVLLGTSTFWEGVDVKGEALSCVIIDKLPFASPEDPITKGRIDYLKQQGVSAFDAYTLPQAVIALKQGIGRLIRDASDKGIFIIADPRLIGRNYGAQIFASLPPVQRTRNMMQALLFIENMGIKDEMVSD